MVVFPDVTAEQRVFRPIWIARLLLTQATWNQSKKVLNEVIHGIRRRKKARFAGKCKAAYY